MHYLDFERPIAELEGKIVELRKLAEEDPAMDIHGEFERLQSRADHLVRETYGRLSSWQKVQVARHPARPHFLDYAKILFDDMTPLAGDRGFGEDAAIMAGLARFQGQAIAFILFGFGALTYAKHPEGIIEFQTSRSIAKTLKRVDKIRGRAQSDDPDAPGADLTGHGVGGGNGSTPGAAPAPNLESARG